MTAKRAYKQFHIGFSKEEWEIVCRKAKAARLRNGTYVRRMGDNLQESEVRKAADRHLHSQNVGQGRNQILRTQRACNFEKSIPLHRQQSQSDCKGGKRVRFGLSKRHRGLAGGIQIFSDCYAELSVPDLSDVHFVR